MIKRTETEHTVQFELGCGTKLQLNKKCMTEVGEALELLCRLDKALQHIMPLPSEQIAEIMEAHTEGRLTIWPRTGQELWFDATGMCERCPAAESDRCPHQDEVAIGFYPDCVPYVSSESWLGGEDTDQRNAFLDGDYYMTEDEAFVALMKKGESE